MKKSIIISFAVLLMSAMLIGVSCNDSSEPEGTADVSEPVPEDTDIASADDSPAASLAAASIAGTWHGVAGSGKVDSTLEIVKISGRAFAGRLLLGSDGRYITGKVDKDGETVRLEVEGTEQWVGVLADTSVVGIADKWVGVLAIDSLIGSGAKPDGGSYEFRFAERTSGVSAQCRKLVEEWGAMVPLEDDRLKNVELPALWGYLTHGEFRNPGEFRITGGQLRFIDGRTDEKIGTVTVADDGFFLVENIGPEHKLISVYIASGPWRYVDNGQPFQTQPYSFDGTRRLMNIWHDWDTDGILGRRDQSAESDVSISIIGSYTNTPIKITWNEVRGSKIYEIKVNTEKAETANTYYTITNRLDQGVRHTVRVTGYDGKIGYYWGDRLGYGTTSVRATAP